MLENLALNRCVRVEPIHDSINFMRISKSIMPYFQFYDIKLKKGKYSSPAPPPIHKGTKIPKRGGM